MSQQITQSISLINMISPPGPVSKPGDCPGYGRELPRGWRCPPDCPLLVPCYEQFEKGDIDAEAEDPDPGT